MSDAKTVISQFIHEAWNERRADACDRHLAEDYLHFMPGLPEPMPGAEGYRAVIAAFTSSFPDLSMTVDEAFGEGDRACAVWTARGTHQGDYNGLAPTGKPISLQGVAVATTRDGKLTKVISMYDSNELGRQLEA